MSTANYLEANLSGLVAAYGWEKVLSVVEELIRREVRVRKRCWYTGKPLAHVNVCSYCTHPKCPIAGGRK